MNAHVCIHKLKKVNKLKNYFDKLEFELFKDELIKTDTNKNNQLIHDYIVTNLRNTYDGKMYKQRNIHFCNYQSRT